VSLPKGRRTEAARDLADRERLVHDEPARSHAVLEVFPPGPQQEARAEQQVEVAGRQRVGVEVSSPLKNREPAPKQSAPGRQEPVDGQIDAVRDEASLGQGDGVTPLTHRQVERAGPGGRSSRS
jgi:hypothetical protein